MTSPDRRPLRPAFRPSRSVLLVLSALAGLIGLPGCAPLPPAGADTAASAKVGTADELAGGHAGTGVASAMPEQTPMTATPVATVPAPAVAPAADATPPALIALDPLEPTEPLNLDDAAARTDLWARVRQGFAMPEHSNELVRKWEQWYAGRPDYVQRMTERGGRYLFHIVEEVNKRGMPTELALLPFIESAYNPQAQSVAKASGMWQFVPATGRDFSLTQNVFRDDRRDVLASTRAALDYLQTLHTMFGDWQLALAAYNWGQGNVARAIKRNQAAGLATDYDSLRMPDETRNYLPKLQAVKNIVTKPDAFALTLPTLRNHPYFVSVGIARDIDIELAAKLAGLPLDEFRQLNPQMNKPVILAAGTPQVLLPYDSANQFVHALEQHRGTLASWTAWVAPRTLKPAEAAQQVGMPEDKLRAVNNIPRGMLVKAGSTLLVPRDAQRHEDVAEQVAENAMLALAPDLPPFKRVSFHVGRKGDSVAAVARRFHVTTAQVAQWNKTTALARFKPGQAVVLMLPAKAAAAVVASAEPERAAPAPASRSQARAVAVAAKAPRRVAQAKVQSQRVAAKASGGSRRGLKATPAARTRVVQN